MFSLENTRFFLEFSTNSRTEIAEPTGFDASHFTLQKETGRMGRDVLFSGETLEFNPTVQINGLTHQFPALIQRYDNKGFESDILFIIEINGTDYVIGQLDFANAETDRITYLRCSVIQDTKQAILKRHLTTKVDLYSNKDIYDNTITPLTPKKVLLNSLPLKQTSSWEKPADFNNNFIPPDPNILSVHWNPFNMITTSGIENTLSPKPTVTYSPVSGSFYTGFETLEAVNTLTNVQAKLSGCTWNFAYFPTTAWTHNIWFSVGFDVNNITKEVSYPVPASASGYSAVFNVPPMERGEKLYVFIRFVMGTPPNQDLNVSITQGSLTIDTTSTAVSSITDGIRLGDAFRQVIKSISGSSLNAPMFEASGDLYNQIIFKGNQLRLIQDKPFTVSFEDLLKQLPEINADYEVQPDGNIFIGLEDSFYTNNSCGNFPISPNAVFKESFSDKYKVNKVEFKYSKFEDGNNEEEENSLLSVHTEAQYPILNKQVENTKSIQVGMVRCAYLLEKTRKRNILITDNSAKSEDETIFIVDCIPGSEFKTETFLLKHFIDNSNRLILTNDGSFDFSLLGIIGNIISGTQVIIPAGFENEGLYRCASVSVTSLELLKLDSPPADFTGIKLTMLQYLPTAELKSRRDENITFLGIEHPTANMRFNIRQNLLDYYSKYLFTSHFYNDATIMKTAYFRSGADVYIRYSPIPIGAGFMIQDIERNRFRLGLVTPKIIETEVIATFTQFWACLMAIRTKRGYIQVSDTQGNIKQIYPDELDYDWRNFLLTIKGEEKR